MLQLKKNSVFVVLERAGWVEIVDGRKEMFYLMTHSIHFYLRLYGVWHMVKDYSDSGEETSCHHISYSFWLASKVLLYTPSHRQDSIYHSLCYTCRGALAGMRNSSMGPPENCGKSINDKIIKDQLKQFSKYFLMLLLSYFKNNPPGINSKVKKGKFVIIK